VGQVHFPSDSQLVAYLCCNATILTSDVAVFTGKDASRALAQSSLKPEECRPEWEDLSEEHQKVLADWYTFFSKRYNIIGKVAKEEGQKL
jgi:hypothetical protein